MDILDFLTNDHDSMRKHLVEIRRSLGHVHLKEKIEEFVKNYKIHEAIEDHILFPPVEKVMQASDDKTSLISGYEKTHAEVWELLLKMTHALPGCHPKDLQQAFFEFSAAVEIHLGEEERVLFPIIRQNCDPKMLEDLRWKAEEFWRTTVMETHPAAGMPKRILVPVDFSKPSIEALDFAAMLAGQMGAEIVLMTVEMYVPIEGFPSVVPDLNAAERRLKELFERRIKHWSQDPLHAYEKKLKVSARFGIPVEQILKAADDLNADMIIMGTHGRRGIPRAILGSVTEQVIRRAPCPVMAIRAGMSHLSGRETAPEKMEVLR